MKKLIIALLSIIGTLSAIALCCVAVFSNSPIDSNCSFQDFFLGLNTDDISTTDFTIEDLDISKVISYNPNDYCLKLLSNTIDNSCPVVVHRCVCCHTGGKVTVYYAIVSKEHTPQLVIANDTNNTTEYATKVARREDAIICINAGIFNMNTLETIGFTIADGQVVNSSVYDRKLGSTDYLYMGKDGMLQLFPFEGALGDLVELNPQWAVLGFYPICVDGEYLYKEDPDYYEPRTFIGQDYEGNYILGACSGRMEKEAGLSLKNIYDLTKKIGFEPRILYNLDGGGSSAFVYKGVRLNKLTQNEDRPCANFIIIK